MAIEPQATLTDAATARDERREFPIRDKQSLLEELDEHGDVVFRFRIEPRQDAETLTLEEYYREAVLDLLRIVRVFSKGKPVIVDAFAFLNAPHDQISLIGPSVTSSETPAPSTQS